jgi:hypothetical protein
MLLRKKLNDPIVMMQLGNLLLFVALTCMFKLHPATPWWDDVADGFTGTLYGAGFGLLALSVRSHVRSKRLSA